MDINNILKLIEAGYTKEEISALTGEEPKKEEPKKEEPAKEPEQENKYDDLLKTVVAKFDELKQSIIESNITNSNNQKVETPEPAELLAKIIKPERK